MKSAGLSSEPGAGGLPVGGRLILASGSARRRTLLAEAGWPFEVIAPSIAEPQPHWGALGAKELAESLAYFKARSVWEKNPGAWVVGADTVVALGSLVFGKADDAEEARSILRTLAGTRHAVVTGVALLGPGEQRIIASDTTYVTMRKAHDKEIEEYVRSGEWQGKAGAYAIQETGDRFVQKVEGSFTNVVGMPMELLRRMLARAGHPPA